MRTHRETYHDDESAELRASLACTSSNVMYVVPEAHTPMQSICRFCGGPRANERGGAKSRATKSEVAAWETCRSADGKTRLLGDDAGPALDEQQADPVGARPAGATGHGEVVGKDACASAERG